MLKTFQISSLLIAIIFLCACEVNFDANNRSGTLEDDYVEEPLSNMSQKYGYALQTSNALIERMKSNDLDFIYEKLFSDELRALISREEFQKMINKIHNAKGNIVRFKKMQWGFIPGTANGRSLIRSVKIVEHENGMVKYLVVFDENKLDKIVGMHFKERDGVSAPGQF